MDNPRLSIQKIGSGLTPRYRQAGAFAAAVVTLASSLALGQTNFPTLHQTQPLLNRESTNSERRPEGESATAYVNGASKCGNRTGNKDCSSGGGPFRKLGEGVAALSAGGMLFLRAGSYNEPIVLTKKMEIRAYEGTATIDPSSLAPFDLVADTLDDNLLPLNPKWGAQIKDPSGLPDSKSCGDLVSLLKRGTCAPFADLPCTHQFTPLDCGTGSSGSPGTLVCVAPHVNWFPATYQGRLTWSNHTCALPCGDDDYNVFLQRDDRAGSTTANPDNLLLEFDSDETVDHFKTPWWASFHAAVDLDGCSGETSIPGCPSPKIGSRAHAMIDGKFAIVTGLAGLDCEHECHSELHPVWALAINAKPGDVDDLWVFFVRNWGNEGFCGTSQHFIDLTANSYTVRLPWKPGETSVAVMSESFLPYHTTQPPPSIRVAPGEGIFVTFSLDEPKDDNSMWNGELHLKWGGS